MNTDVKEHGRREEICGVERFLFGAGTSTLFSSRIPKSESNPQKSLFCKEAARDRGWRSFDFTAPHTHIRTSTGY
jgi:hypothetical protein